MKNRFYNCFSQLKNIINRGMNVLSVLFVLFLPLFIVMVFCRLLTMTGVPVWFLFVAGAVLIGSLGQTVYFVVFERLGKAISRWFFALKQNFGQVKNAEGDA